MSFDIKKLTEVSPLKEKKYLIDANIWIKVISPKIKPTNKDQKYCEFIEDLRNRSCKIYLPALVISEVMNRLLREVHLPKLALKMGIDSENIPPNFYKEIFRKSTEYRSGYLEIADDFNNFIRKGTDIINDSFGSKDGVKFRDVLGNNFNNRLDFNDNFYYQLAKKNNYTIITDDKDFLVKGVEVLTLSRTLLLDSSKANQ